MGIKNLSKAIQRFAPNAVRRISLDQLRGKVVAVDTAIFLWRFKACRMDPVFGIRTQIRRLRSLGIEPYYFLDGPSCAAKAEEQLARSQQRYADRHSLSLAKARVAIIQATLAAKCAARCASTVANNIRCDAAVVTVDTKTTIDNNLAPNTNNIATDDQAIRTTTTTPPVTPNHTDSLVSTLDRATEKCIKLQRRVFSGPTKAEFAAVRTAFSELGVKCYQSVHDGEKACAWAVRMGICDVVMSEDFDCVPYNARFLITGVGSGNFSVKQYDVDAIRVGFGNWTPEQMVLYCILLGSDLCAPRVKGVGPVKAKNLVTLHPTLDSLLAAINKDKRLVVPPDMRIAAKRAVDEFLDSTQQAVILDNPDVNGT